MSKHEIRLRRQKLTSRGADRFRNYGAVLHRVEEQKRIKKILRVFGYFLVILILVMLLVIVIRVEKKGRSTRIPKQTSLNINPIEGAGCTTGQHYRSA